MEDRGLSQPDQHLILVLERLSEKKNEKTEMVGLQRLRFRNSFIYWWAGERHQCPQPALHFIGSVHDSQ
jgi:hypothetical protein